MRISKDSYAAVTGEKDTPQRLCIQRAIRRAEGPLTIEQIYQAALKEVPGMGVATVYRTVKLLVDQRQIRSVNLPDGICRYQPFDAGPHHFQCLGCKKIITLKRHQILWTPQFQLGGGFIVEKFESVLHGRCPACPKPWRNS